MQVKLEDLQRMDRARFLTFVRELARLQKDLGIELTSVDGEALLLGRVAGKIVSLSVFDAESEISRNG